MVAVNVRELTHNFAGYLKRVEQGDRVVVMVRNKPVAEIIPRNENIEMPSWKMVAPKVRLKGGVMASKQIVKYRDEERG
ncbi:MAG: type II toxin-antitoxin system prevent-host-death family antitoxin [Candidatus Omnitrophica bacterium]|nr:type II toxin-antitoxin system prevent-host-death family antitoxin [Candidatus Omnitrophota bacterium]